MEETMHVLLVDDDDVDRMAARRSLKSASVPVKIEEASNAAAALQAMQRQEFDCIFMDYELPDSDGLSTLHQARKAGITTPFVMLTGHGDEQIAVELMKAGAADYLNKGKLTPDSLWKSLHSAIRIHEAEVRAQKTQEALRESEERFRTMADSAPMLLWLADAEANYTFFNDSWLEFTGRTLEQESGEGWIKGVHPSDVERCLNAYQAAFHARQKFQREYRLRRADGAYRWILDKGKPRFTPEGHFAGYIGSCIDITERIEAEAILRENQDHIAALNEELRRAMTETHHRVRNSLQLIASMVDMQTMRAKRVVPVSELRQLGLHIHSMAVVHEILTQQAKLDGKAEAISSRMLLEKLLPTLQRVAIERPITFTMEEAQVSAKEATSLAFIVNELVSNALKYGESEVEIALKVQGREMILIVCDDGPGFPEHFNPLQASGTGLELVENLSRWNLRGTSHYENRASGGACVTISFPLT